jgi:hypothetical protein
MANKGLEEAIEKYKVGKSQDGILTKPRKDHSWVPGAAVTVGGIAGVGYLLKKRFPFLNLVPELTKTPLGKSKALVPPPRITEPKVIDKVDEIIKSGKTETFNAMQTVEKLPPVNVKSASNIFSAKAAATPLTQGSGKGRFGSALYDFIATHPSKKPLSAQQWINEFANHNRMATLRSTAPGFEKVKMRIDREELFDANIANFNKSNELVGGYLFNARKMNIPVSKEDLLTKVVKSPAVNFKVIRFEDTVQAGKEMAPVITSTLNQIKNAKSNVAKLVNEPGIANIDDTLTQITDDLLTASRSFNRPNISIGKQQEQLRNVEESLADLLQTSTQFKNVFSAKNKAIPVPAFIDTAALNIQKQKVTDYLRQVNQIKKSERNTRYGDRMEYRTHGDERYIEDLIVYPKNMPWGKNISPSHYERIGGKEINNQIYHVRYGQRTTDGGEKVFMIHEGQADYAQHAMRSIRSNRKNTSGISEPNERFNPFNREGEFLQANISLRTLREQMNALTNKGLKMTEKDFRKLNELRRVYGDIKMNTINSINLATKRAASQSDDIGYLPMIQRDQWGDHMIKHVAKTGAESNVQWVAINPVEKLHGLKREVKLGDLEFYGTAKGKAGIPGLLLKGKQTNVKQTAVLPQRMIDLAKQYNSEAKTIRISLSDPNKPYKVIETRKGKPELNIKGAKEHVAAFSTQAEAEAFAASTQTVKYIPKDDVRNYYEVFALKITPEMLGQPFKLYKKEGGLVVNLFKW